MTFADAVAAHVEPVCRPACSRRHIARSPAQRSRRSAARSLAPRRNASASTASTAHAAQSDRRRLSAMSIGTDTRQQWRPTTRRAHIACQNCFTVSCRGSA
jgi:hypothetical protein